MNIRVIDGNSQIMSGLIGNTLSSDLLSQINRKLQTFTNENFKNIQDVIERGKKIFINKVIKPQQKLKYKINQTLNELTKDNDIIPLITDDDFKNIPASMFIPILTYGPVRMLLDDDKINGFDIDKKKVMKYDPYRRLIYNGICNRVDEKFEKNQEIVCISSWKYDDFMTDLSDEMIDAIEYTRIKIDQLLEKGIDPTDYPNQIRN